MPRKGTQYWVGLDGEGVGRSPHRFVLLARSDAKGRRAYIENPKGLGTKECLAFLLASPSNARLCGYYLGYDWTMILRDLPNQSIYRLLRPELRALPRGEGGGFSYIRWKGYRLHYLAGMMRVACGKQSVTVWDVGKFFQAPFVESLTTWQIDAPVEAIADMKGERSTFGLERLPEIRRYCLSECKALAVLAAELERAHDGIKLKPSAWYGPGSTASAGLRSLGIQKARGEAPPEVTDAANRAFFGGRFEHSTVGFKANVQGWDIASAYPYHAYRLPCLEHGRWTLTRNARKLEGARHACVRWRMRDIGAVPWGPLPCRLADGTIVFPRSGCTGWAWRDEWQQASQHWTGLDWESAWILDSDCECRPFERVLAWYRERLILGKSQRGRALKLFLNSLYGKLAQTIGRPQYASRIWAGMITSGTRAQLLSMIAQHKNQSAVCAVATDGLYTTEVLEQPQLPLAPDTLGSWERTVYAGMVFVRPGIYWSTDEQDITLRSRGMARKQLLGQREAVLDAIEGDDARAMVGTTTLFGGARACVFHNPRTGQYKRSQYYGEWHDIPGKVSLAPAPKRTPDWGLHCLGGVESAPYGKAVSADSKTLHAWDELFWAML